MEIAEVPATGSTNTTTDTAAAAADPAEVPTGQTDVPTGQTEVPTVQTDVPTVQNDVPTGQNDVPADPGGAGQRMSGFPPTRGSLVTLATWQEEANLRWAFRHMRDSVPSALGAPVTRLDGTTTTAEDVFATTWTDALLVLQDGRIVDERYYDGMTGRTPHLLMSVTKSLVGCVAGVLAARGLLDTEEHVTTYVPEAADSGYGGAVVRNLLDMRTGVAFRETYTEATAEVRVMERSMGWRPRLDDDPVGTYDYLTTLSKADRHGGPFAYRSADTDMLGWVCERASGTRMADLISTLLWVPMGAERDAEITCDPVGSAIHDGGVSAVPRDVARFGQMLLDDGMIDGWPVVPAAWLHDAHNPETEVREAFAQTDNESVLPGGWYRNKFWFVPSGHGTALVCLGIHGQMIYVNRETRTVGVKLSSWPEAQSVTLLVDTLRAFASVCARLGGPDESLSGD